LAAVSGIRLLRELLPSIIKPPRQKTLLRRAHAEGAGRDPDEVELQVGDGARVRRALFRQLRRRAPLGRQLDQVVPAHEAQHHERDRRQRPAPNPPRGNALRHGGGLGRDRGGG